MRIGIWQTLFAAALLGFTGIAGTAAGIAKVLFGLFLAICAILFLIGLFAARKV